MRIFDVTRRLAVAAHFLIAIAALVLAIARFNSGVGAATILTAALFIIFSAPLIPMLMRARRRASSAANGSYITRLGSTLGTMFGVVGLGLLLVAAGLGGDAENRLGAALGAMLALWLSSLTMELSRRRRRV